MLNTNKQNTHFAELYDFLIASDEPLTVTKLLVNLSGMKFSVTELEILKNRIEWNFTGFEEVVEAIEKLIAKHLSK